VLAASYKGVMLSLAETLPIALTVRAAISNSVDLVFRMVTASVNQGKKDPSGLTLRGFWCCDIIYPRGELALRPVGSEGVGINNLQRLC
jgi:hypothetical protein